MADVLTALAWLFGALALVVLLVWGSLRSSIKAAKLRREATEERDRDDP